MKCCVSTDVGTWTNWLTFEPDPYYSPDAGTGLPSPISYKRCYAEFYVRKIPRTRIGGPPLPRCVILKCFFFTVASEHLCRRYMRSTKCPSSCPQRIGGTVEKLGAILNVAFLGGWSDCVALFGCMWETSWNMVLGKWWIFTSYMLTQCKSTTSLMHSVCTNYFRALW